MEKKKKFDAVKMVREIRDKLYEETKDMSDKERIEHIRKDAAEFRASRQKVKKNNEVA